ncbi:hypothetical protein [Streptomyces sp. Wb2n-11]|uniref:hypothetical protein n=1 Tax=Streptomyces sp. Wb2n-11 TaxID=1030533 RepID=UPI000A8B411D|nr:hypothetical protein [Streptomyces sp. Wb2n-11]
MEPSSTGAGAKVEAHAEAVVLAACRLADTAGPGQWSPGAIEDASSALEVLAGALAQLDSGSAEILAVIPAAVAALREHTEQARAGAPAGEGTAGRGAAAVSGPLRQALAVHGIGRGRVHQLGAALVTVTLEAADAQALAALLTPRGEHQEHRVTEDTEALWGVGPAGTAAAALGQALAAYGTGSYARVIDSEQVTAGLTPHAARQLTTALTTRSSPAARTRRRGLGHGWKGLDTTSW